MANRNVTLKRNNAGTTEELYPTTDWSQINSKPTTFTPTSHTHTLSDITDAGTVAAVNLNSSTTQYLRGDGTWQTVTSGSTFTGGTITGNLEISNTLPKITLTDTDHNSDFNISNNNGVFTVGDTTNQEDRFRIYSSGDVEITGSSVDIAGVTLLNDGGTLKWDGTNVSLNGHTHTFASLTSKPTTLSGYGITDAYTQAQVNSQISAATAALVDSSPATLDTLNELAAALGDDPNFATTVSNSIGTKVSKSGDTMTGTLTASGGINGLTLSNGISGSNFNITGVNTLEINDPGEGIVFKQGSSGDMSLAIVDDANDNILRFGGTNAVLQVNTNTVFHDGYHPNADKLTTARNIALTGAVTGNANFDGSGNISIATTHTADPVITLTGAVTGSGTMTNLGSVSIATTATADPTLTINGDASGSATFTNLGNATLTLTVNDDSHNHIISNVDGLQAALDGKLGTSAKAADSNLLDGIDSGSFLRSDTADIASGKITFSAGGSGNFIGTPGGVDIASVTTGNLTIRNLGELRFGNNNNWDYNEWAGIKFDSSTEVMTIGGPASTAFASNASPPLINVNFDGLNTSGLKVNNNTVWHAGNDGSGSGLDADTVDGLHASSFAAASHTHTPSQVGLGNVSNAAQVTTTNNSSLNSDSRNTRGVTRLYRRDDNSDFSVQHYWTGSYWYLRGYNADNFHAEVQVGYANSAGNAGTLDGVDSSQFLRSDTIDTMQTRLYLHQSGSGGGQNLFTGVEAATSANGRAQFILSSAYSDLVIASSQANNNHGSTLTFAAYNPSNAGDYRKFVINQGGWGSRQHMLDFGYENSSITNPHDAINSTDTVLTLDGINKRVGIGAINPSQKLDVAGNVIASSYYINDTATRLLEGSGNALRIQTSTGYVDIGSMNSSWTHIQTDRARFYFGSPVSIHGNLQDYATGSTYWHSGNLTNLNQLTNGPGYVTSSGVTSVATGGGLTGGTITSTGTISHADTSSQASVNNSGNTFIQDITLDGYGHITAITSATANNVGNADTVDGYHAVAFPRHLYSEFIDTSFPAAPLTNSFSSWAKPTGTPSITLEANSVYFVQCEGLYYSAASTTGIGISPTFSTVSGQVIAGRIYVLDSTTLTGITSEDTGPWRTMSTSAGQTGNYILTTSSAPTSPAGTYFGFQGYVETSGSSTVLSFHIRSEVNGSAVNISRVSLMGLRIASA